jgi:hypothetical protein
MAIKFVPPIEHRLCARQTSDKGDKAGRQGMAPEIGAQRERPANPTSLLPPFRGRKARAARSDFDEI